MRRISRPAFCLLMLLLPWTLVLAGCDDTRHAETARAGRGEGGGNGTGGGHGGGRGGDGVAGCQDLALRVDGETLWTASLGRLPDHAGFSTYEERPAFSLSSLLDAYPDLQSVMLQSCGPRQLELARWQLVEREKLLVLNQRGFWKLAERDGSPRLKSIMLNVREVRVSTSPVTKAD